MSKPSEVDAGPGKPLRVDSLWSILRHGCETDPDQTALIAPTQPSHHLQGLVRPANLSLSVGATGFWGLFLRRIAAWLTRYVSRMFLPTPSFAGGLSWSFAELLRAATRLGSVLDSNHIPKGATLLVLIPTCAEWTLMLWLSALKCYTLVTLDTTVLQPGHEQELQSYLKKLAPAAIVVRSQDDAINVDLARGKIETEDPFLGITLDPLTGPRHGWTSMTEISESKFLDDVEIEGAAADDLDRVAIIVFTGGTTTGTPRGCLRTVGDLLRPLAGINGPPPLRPPTVLINSNSFGSLAPSLLYSTWYSGNAAVLVGGPFNAATTISTMGSCRPIAVAVYPHMIDLIREHTDLTSEKVKSVKFLIVIGAVIVEETLTRAQKTFPKAKIIASYSMTEAAGMFGWPRGPPAANAVPTFKGIVSCGMPLPGVKLKIVDEDGRAVGRSKPGMLHLCGDMVAKGYLGDEGIGSFYEDGGNRWYVTGDCALLDEREHIYILGRYDHMIKRNGIMIAPATIENVIMTHFSQQTVVVVGISTAEREERVYAIFRKATQNSDEVKDLVVKHLGLDYRLDGVFDLSQLGLADWPNTSASKLSVFEIRRMLLIALEKATSG